MTMNAKVRLMCVGFSLSAMLGCRGGMPPRRALAASEPALEVPGESAGAVITTTPRTGAGSTVVSRHPLLSKPRDYYESSGNNKVVKTAAATVIGIPAGVVGELRQIVVGVPQTQR